LFQAAEGIRARLATGVQTCALPICLAGAGAPIVGDQVTVVCELVTDEWRTSSGETRSRIKIKAHRIHPHRRADAAPVAATETQEIGRASRRAAVQSSSVPGRDTNGS